MEKIIELRKFIEQLEITAEKEVDELENSEFELDFHDSKRLAEENAILGTLFLIKRKITEIYGNNDGLIWSIHLVF